MTHAQPSSPKSISVLTFSPDNVLFVGDSKGAAIFAYELGPSAEAAAGQAFSIAGIDQRIADLLGVTVDQLTIRDMVVHPKTHEAYIALHRGHGAQAQPVIVRVNPKGDIHALDLAAIPHTQAALPNPVGDGITLWNQIEARTLAITALKLAGGELFVSGLSSAEFSSTLYRIPYPFAGSVKTSSIEIYHAAHGQNETRAPIRTLSVLELGGQPHVLAAYTCTPLVTIPVAALADGAHVTGKTIGELGFGNTPIDMLHFHSQDMQGNQSEHVLLSNRNRGAMLFDVATLTARNTEAGLSQPTPRPSAPQYDEVPLAGVVHIDVQDAGFLAALRRDHATGRLDLVSFRTGLYFRLGDFVGEYALPGYPMASQPEQFQGFYRMLQHDEGF